VLKGGKTPAYKGIRPISRLVYTENHRNRKGRQDDGGEEQDSGRTAHAVVRSTRNRGKRTANKSDFMDTLHIYR